MEENEVTGEGPAIGGEVRGGTLWVAGGGTGGEGRVCEGEVDGRLCVGGSSDLAVGSSVTGGGYEGGETLVAASEGVVGSLSPPYISTSTSTVFILPGGSISATCKEGWSPESPFWACLVGAGGWGVSRWGSTSAMVCIVCGVDSFVCGMGCSTSAEWERGEGRGSDRH